MPGGEPAVVFMGGARNVCAPPVGVYGAGEKDLKKTINVTN
jgi:hypothetical protein